MHTAAEIQLARANGKDASFMFYCVGPYSEGFAHAMYCDGAHHHKLHAPGSKLSSLRMG